MNDVKSENIVDWTIRRVNVEIKDLNHFWNDLSDWEQEDSILSALQLLKISTVNKRSPDQEKKIDDLKQKAKKIQMSIKKPAFFEKLFRKDLEQNKSKPNMAECLHIIIRLSEKEHIELAKYLGFENIDEIRKNFENFPDFFCKVSNKSLASFYAMRNYLGKHYKLTL